MASHILVNFLRPVWRQNPETWIYLYFKNVQKLLYFIQNLLFGLATGVAVLQLSFCINLYVTHNTTKNTKAAFVKKDAKVVNSMLNVTARRKFCRLWKTILPVAIGGLVPLMFSTDLRSSLVKIVVYFAWVMIALERYYCKWADGHFISVFLHLHEMESILL